MSVAQAGSNDEKKLDSLDSPFKERILPTIFTELNCPNMAYQDHKKGGVNKVSKSIRSGEEIFRC